MANTFVQSPSSQKPLVMSGNASASVLSGEAATSAVFSVTQPRPSLFVASDSIQAQSFTPPSSTFGATISKGTFQDGSGVRQVGVTDIFSENPARLKFRAAHNLVTGDEILLAGVPSNHVLSTQRFIVTVTAADEVTLNGVDATGLTPFTSAANASDAVATVDMAYGNYGPLSWFLTEAGDVFSSINTICRPGATSSQLNAQPAWSTFTGTYSLGILHIGRNDPTFDQPSLEALRDKMLSRCQSVLIVLPFPDSNWTGSSTVAAAKIASISAFWYAQQATNPRFFICDGFGALSDPAGTLEATASGMLGSDGVHPQANGALVLGLSMARAIVRPLNAIRRALSRTGTNGANLLTGGRFTGSAGIVGTGATGTVATGFTLGTRSSANVSWTSAQVCRTPALVRRSSAAYAAGDILDIGDGFWYMVKTAGTTALVPPTSSYSSASLWDAVASAPATTLTLSSSAVGTGVTATAGVATFSASDVGKFIGGSGTALITGFTSSTVVTISIQIAFAGTTLNSGTWTLNGRIDPITDGTAILIKIPKFTESLDQQAWQFVDLRITADNNNEHMSFFQSVNLPGSVVVGDYIKGSMDVVFAGGFPKYSVVRLSANNSTPTLIGRAHALAPNNVLTRMPQLPIKARTLATPRLRVPQGTASLELRLTMSTDLNGAQFFISLPMIEKV